MSAAKKDAVPLLLLKWHLLGRALAMPSLSAGDVAVLWQLSNRYNEQAGAAWPSLSRLAADTGRQRNTVLRSIGRLKRAGLVVVVSAGTRTTSTRYRPAFGVATPPTPPGSHAEGARGSHAEGAEVATPAWPESIYEPGHGFIDGESVAAASDALTRAAAAPPAGVDADGWKKLLSARPELDSAALAEQAAFHLAEGCPAKALNRAVDGLRLTLHHKGLSPSYKRANGSAAAPRPRKRAAPVESFKDVDYHAEL